MRYPIGSKQRPLSVAIIGSGPSGFYAAEALFKQEELCVELDMFERLPTPYGLVRAGVAPDHQQIKSVSRIFENIALLPQFRFWGNVHFGNDIRKAEVLEHFDAVIYAVGSQTDRSMAIPGEELLGSHSATEFVGWYNGHPDYAHLEFDFSTPSVAVIGVGNVAVDIARILARTPDELTKTDIARHALDQLGESKIREIYLIARRGPMQSAFTSAGTKSLHELTGAVAVVDPSELRLEAVSQQILEQTKDRRIIQNMDFLNRISKNQATEKSRCIRFLFRRSPMEIYGQDGIVKGLKIVKNELFEDEYGALKARATDVSEDIKAGLVFRSIGYVTEPIPDVSFDPKRGLIANEKGRVVDFQSRTTCPREYVVGWAKRGPTGIIGTNKPDAIETVQLLFEDYRNRQAEPSDNSQAQIVSEFLQSKGVSFVPFEDWRLLDQAEVEEGEKRERPREKITTVQEMFDIIQEKRLG